jgi:hypothetical protein
MSMFSAAQSPECYQAVALPPVGPASDAEAQPDGGDDRQGNGNNNDSCQPGWPACPMAHGAHGGRPSLLIYDVSAA